MNARWVYVLLGFSAALLSSSFSKATDVDIYFTDLSSIGTEPMVMFSIDWRPSLTATTCNGGEDVDPSNGIDDDCDEMIADGYIVPEDPANIKAFEMYRGVLKKVFEPLSGVQVGFMMAHEDGTGPSCSGPDAAQCSNGGFIPFGFRSLETGDTNGTKAAFDAMLGSMPLPQGTESHKLQASEIFFEFYRYLTGGEIYNGHNGFESFDGNSGSGSINTDTEHSFAWDTAIESGTNYISPLQGAGACTRIFSISFIFGTINQDSDSDSAIEETTANGGLGINVANNNNDRFQDILSWLENTDLADGTLNNAPDLSGMQNVTSYFLVPSVNNTENAFASAGGTNAAIQLSNNPAELAEDLENILKEILGISTTFVAASVPVNVFNRTEVLDNIFLALFQPRHSAAWPGNLKKLRLANDGNGELILMDAQNPPQQAISADGRIKYDALTFWTDVDQLPYDENAAVPDPNVLDEEANLVVDGRDGRFVARGGSGQRIAGILPGTDPGELNIDANARQLYTENDGGTALISLDADDLTNIADQLLTNLGAANAVESLCLLKYIRGYNVTNIDATGCLNTGSARSWLMGDLLHSRPYAINYGGADQSNPDIRVVVGSNDGFFRMIRNATGAGAPSGAESWAFMPRAVMGIIPTLASNAQSSADHPYGVDGSPTVYTYDDDRDGTIETADGDKVWVYFGLRRGGKHYYALDVSNPDAPSLLWTISDSDTGFGELGLTFSQPAIGRLNWGSGAKPVLVFGGGYDTKKDAVDGDGDSVVYPTAEADGEGNAIFVVDAETGALVWKAVQSGTSTTTTYVNADMKDSIISEVALLDSNNDKLTDRGYVGDTGGVLWRIDFSGSDRANWTAEAMLSVGRHAPDGNGDVVDRRFFEAVDYAFSKDDSGNFDAVMIGSGDRANALEGSISNEFYMFKDRLDGHPQCSTGGASPQPRLCTDADLADLTDSSCLDDDSCSGNLNHGWRVGFQYNGEKALSSALTADGTIFFSTYVPPAHNSITCEPNEGSGRLYALNLQNAKADRNFDLSNDSGSQTVMADSDRGKFLLSGGIPSQVVPMPVGVLYDITKLQNPDPGMEGFVSANLADSAIDDLQLCASDFGCEDGGSMAPDITFWHQEKE